MANQQVDVPTTIKSSATGIKNVYGNKGGGGHNPAAYSFLNATGITDPTITAATNFLTNSLKGIERSYNAPGYDLWSGAKCIHPFVGGTASTHKFNLKDPRDLDAAFRITFSGGWTHSATGAAGNGTNAYGTYNYIPSTEETINSSLLGIYLRGTNLTGTQIIGSYSNTDENVLYLAPNSVMVLGGQNGVNFGPVTPQGFYLANRTASNSMTAYRNGLASSGTTVIPMTALSPQQLHEVCAANAVGARNYYVNNEIAFRINGAKVTAAQAIVLNAIVTQFQTMLGRNV